MPAAQDALHREVEALYSHHGWLQGWLRGKLGCAHQAADLAHDTFVRILGKQEPVAVEAPRAYLATVAKGLVLDFHRRRALERAYLDALAAVPMPLWPSAEERAIALEALTAIDRMLDGLKPRTRQAFLLSQLDGMTYAAIAEKLGVSLRTVHNDMTVALEQCYLLAA